MTHKKSHKKKSTPKPKPKRKSSKKKGVSKMTRVNQRLKLIDSARRAKLITKSKAKKAKKKVIKSLE